METTKYNLHQIKYDILRYLERGNPKSLSEIITNIKEISGSNKTPTLVRLEIPYLISSGFLATNRGTGTYVTKYSITKFGKELLSKRGLV
jgi:hypothetical protein